jgi:hypothetical protein
MCQPSWDYYTPENRSVGNGMDVRDIIPAAIREKISLHDDNRLDRHAYLCYTCDSSNARPVQHISGSWNTGAATVS